MASLEKSGENEKAASAMTDKAPACVPVISPFLNVLSPLSVQIEPIPHRRVLNSAMTRMTNGVEWKLDRWDVQCDWMLGLVRLKRRLHMEQGYNNIHMHNQEIKGMWTPLV